MESTVPLTAHDDMVDAWSQAASRFRTTTAGIWEYYLAEAQLSEKAVACVS